jgi:hypothetical protein
MSIFDLFGPPNIERLKAKNNVRQLIKILEDIEYDVSFRKDAALALGDLKNQQAIEPLLKTFSQLFDFPIIDRYGLMEEHERKHEPNKQMRKAVATALRSLNWEPKNDQQRGLIAIANEEWGEAVRLDAIGKVCLEQTVNESEISKCGGNPGYYAPTLKEYDNLFPPEIITSRESADFIVNLELGMSILGSYRPDLDKVNIMQAVGYMDTVKAASITLRVSISKHSSPKHLAESKFYGSEPETQVQATEWKKEIRIGILPPDVKRVRQYLDAAMDIFIKAKF